MEKQCEFNSIFPEEIITYKFAATINYTKARDKFIKRPLKLQLELETIKLDNYNHKYGDKNPKIGKRRKHPQTVPQTENRLVTLNQYGSRDRKKWTRRKKILEIAFFTEKQIGSRNIHARHGNHSVIIARERDTLPTYADQEP